MQNDTLVAPQNPYELHPKHPVLEHKATSPTPRTTTNRPSLWKLPKNWLTWAYDHPHTQRCINFTSGLCIGSLCYYSLTELFRTLSPAWLAWIPYPTALAVAFSIADVVCTIILFTKSPQPECHYEPHWIWFHTSPCRTRTCHDYGLVRFCNQYSAFHGRWRV